MVTADEDNLVVERRRLKTWQGLLIAGLIFGLAWMVWDYKRMRDDPRGWNIQTASYYKGPFYRQMARYFSDTLSATSAFVEARPMREDEIMWLGRQRRMQRLRLRHCDLRGLDLSPLRGMKGLSSLSFERVIFSPEQMGALFKLPSLEYISISASTIGDGALGPLVLNSHVKDLTIGDVDLSFEALETINGMKHLQSLGLGNMVIDDAVVMPITEHPQLTSLSLYDVEISERNLARLVSHPQLDALSLSSMQVGDAALAPLAGHGRLRNLGLRDVRLSREAFKAIGAMDSLHTLTLFGVDFNGAGIDWIKSLTQLASLSLHGTTIGDAELGVVSQMTKLINIDLSGTNVTVSGLNVFDQHPTLRIIYLNQEITERYAQTVIDFVRQNPQIRIVPMEAGSICLFEIGNLAKLRVV